MNSDRRSSQSYAGLSRAAIYIATVDGCDLTDWQMYIRFWCDAVTALAPVLLAGYRSPFTGAAARRLKLTGSWPLAGEITAVIRHLPASATPTGPTWR